jgi:hypothetical protein
MKSKTAKTYINQLLKRYKSFDIVADKLSISSRYVRLLAKQEKKASPPLIKLMKILLEK